MAYTRRRILTRTSAHPDLVPMGAEKRSYRDSGKPEEKPFAIIWCTLVALFVWSLLGQKLLFTTAIFLGVPTRMLTIPARGITVALAAIYLALALTKFRTIPWHWSFAAFGGFWAVYVFRVAVELASMGEPMSPPPDATYSPPYIAQMVLGACFLPSMAILIAKDWSNQQRIHNLCFTLALITAVGMLWMYRDNILHFQHRMPTGDESGEFVTVSPLQLGYAGLILFSFFLFLVFDGNPWRPGRLAGLAVVGAIGLLLVVGSASRGPVIAFFLMVIPFIASLHIRGRRKDFIIAIIACVLLSIAAVMIAEVTGSSIFDRLYSVKADIDQQTQQSVRLEYYGMALRAFQEGPLFGKQTTFGGFAYPHNLLLESLMATGLVGTLALCTVLGYALYSSWKILTQVPSFGWLALTFYAYLGGALFSGAIFSNTPLWISMAATISVGRIASALSGPRSSNGPRRSRPRAATA